MDKKGKAEFKKAWSAPDAVFKEHKTRGTLLGVEKPPESNASDNLLTQKSLKVKKGNWKESLEKL
jgi:hypothetical protein